MFTVSNGFHTAVITPGRKISLRVVIGALTITNTNILEMSVSGKSGAKNRLTMGQVFSSSVSITLGNDSPITGGYDGVEIVPGIGVDVDGVTEWLDLGKYYISEVASPDEFKTVVITAHDKAASLNQIYVPTGSVASLQSIASNIATQHGFSYYGSIVWPTSPVAFDATKNYTCRDMLGFIAGCMGKNARFRADGKLEFFWYTDSGKTAERGLQFMGGFKRTTEASFVLHSLSSGTKEAPLEAGTGVGIAFEDPFITQAQLNAALTAVNGFTFVPANLHWYGNPAIQVGDTLVAKDKVGTSHKLVVMQQDIKIRGGLTSTIVSGADTEQAYAITPESPSDRKLNRVYTGLQQAIIDASEQITGQKGGYVVINSDANGKPTEILIMNTPDTATATNVWRWNSGGFGHSKTGYNGPFTTAITADGKIVADFIATGTLLADRVRGGSLVLGGSTNGSFALKDASDVTRVLMDKTGVKFYDPSAGLVATMWPNTYFDNGSGGYYGLDIVGTKAIRMVGRHGSWEAALRLDANSTDGVLQAALTTTKGGASTILTVGDGVAMLNGNALWHTGNFDPYEYIPSYNGIATGAFKVVGPMYLDNDNSQFRSLYWLTNGSSRWSLFADSDVESGDNHGSNLRLRRWNDEGGYLSDVLQINREDGVFRFAYTPYAVGNVMYHAGNLDVANMASNPVLYAGGQNANTVTAPFSLGGSNVPVGSFSYLQTMCYPNVTAPTAKVQLGFAYSTVSRAFLRNYHSSEWNSWSELWHSGNFTPTNVPVQEYNLIVKHASTERSVRLQVGTGDAGLWQSTANFGLYDWENNRTVLQYTKANDLVYLRALTQIGNGAYNGGHLVLGTYHLWISSGKLYIKNGAPTTATDGTVVGAQS